MGSVFVMPLKNGLSDRRDAGGFPEICVSNHSESVLKTVTKH